MSRQSAPDVPPVYRRPACRAIAKVSMLFLRDQRFTEYSHRAVYQVGSLSAHRIRTYSSVCSFLDVRRMHP